MGEGPALQSPEKSARDPLTLLRHCVIAFNTVHTLRAATRLNCFTESTGVWLFALDSLISHPTIITGHANIIPTA